MISEFLAAVITAVRVTVPNNMAPSAHHHQKVEKADASKKPSPSPPRSLQKSLHLVSRTLRGANVFKGRTPATCLQSTAS